jgi:hypothetical protein
VFEYVQPFDTNRDTSFIEKNITIFLLILYYNSVHCIRWISVAKYLLRYSSLMGRSVADSMRGWMLRVKMRKWASHHRISIQRDFDGDGSKALRTTGDIREALLEKRGLKEALQCALNGHDDHILCISPSFLV